MSGTTTPGLLPLRQPEEIVGPSSHAQELREMVREIAASRDHIVISGEPGAGKRFLARVIHGTTFHKNAGNLVEISPQTNEDEVRVILFEEDRRRVEGMLGRRIMSLGDHETLLVRNPHEFSIIGQTRISRFLIHNEARAAAKQHHHRAIFSLPVSWAPGPHQRAVIDSLDQYLRCSTRISVLPLRSRREDIPAFLNHFLRALLPLRSTLPKIEEKVMDRLTDHAWHDNVRELKTIVELGVKVSTNGVFVLPDSFVDEVALVTKTMHALLAGKRVNLGEVLNELERAFLRRALARADSDRLKSAHLLGLSDLNIRYRLRKFQMMPPSLRQREKRDEKEY